MEPRGEVEEGKQEQPEITQTRERKNKTEGVQKGSWRPMLHMGQKR